MPQIHFIVLFYHYLFCCIFWNFIYLYFLHVLHFLHLPIYTSSFCLSNSVSKSIKLSFSCTHVLFILFTRSEDLGILTSHLFASATVSKSYITAGTMIPSCKKIAANHPLHSSLPIPPCQHSLLHLSCGLFLDLHGWPQLFNLNLLIPPPHHHLESSARCHTWVVLTPSSFFTGSLISFIFTLYTVIHIFSTCGYIITETVDR